MNASRCTYTTISVRVGIYLWGSEYTYTGRLAPTHRDIQGKAAEWRADLATVLVVEDEHNIAELLGAVLTEEGYQVLVAMNCREGLDLLAQEQPQLLLCDHMMLVMDGSTMLEAMTADPTLRGIPVVMMSAMREAAVARRCSGYAAFLHKPFKVSELLEVVKRTLGTGNVEAS